MKLEHQHSKLYDPAGKFNLSSEEDFRRSQYYVKHMHNLDNTGILYKVFKDNPAPDRNWRGNQSLFSTVSLDSAIEWINKRRCFN